MHPHERFVEQHWDAAVRSARIRATHAPSSEADDILSDAAMGLLAAAESYREDLARSESSWANYKIDKAISDGLRARHGRPGRPGLRRGVGVTYVELFANAGVTRDETDRVLDRVAVGAALARLSERHQQVIVWRYYDDLDLSEIAYHLGTSTSAVSHLLKGIHARLLAQLTSQ